MQPNCRPADSINQSKTVNTSPIHYRLMSPKKMLIRIDQVEMRDCTYQCPPESGYETSEQTSHATI